MTARYKIALAAVLVLFVAAAQAFVYTAYVVPRREAAREMTALTAALRAEIKKPPKKDVENLGVSVSDLLSLVQELAVRSGITVVGIEPVQNAKTEQFRLNLITSYANLTGFLARFERLQVAIGGFEIVPAMDRPNLLAVAIEFNHITAPGAATAEFVANFEEQRKVDPVRDPFNPPARAVSEISQAVGNDLTWTLHLTSISEIGAKKFATIDGKDYAVGDLLQGRIVSQIAPDQVTLTDTAGGQERQLFLRFRSLPQSRT
jgi:hypothetical protein